ncbi:hypothetical protein B7P43_G02444 [Cryptotermes secundus]|uniref:Reverse transcriptase domain-containing protein n=1 Tax=Cryptotermes secundus TaxID=105785 RepID=A0A2J7QVB6_9NEOP|nr:hypothetical protein B7P43_G02444 [Cryptotermes secundus]
MKKCTETLIDAGKEAGLQVNAYKTKYMLLSRHQNAGQNHDIKTANRSFENVTEFNYFGTTVTNHSIQEILSSRLLPENIKIRIYKTIIIRVALYGCELHMRRVSAKFVPRLHGDDQRENRVNVCRDLKSEVQNDPEFLKRIVTGDESWCYEYDPESKQSSSQWKTPTSPRLKKARQVRSNVKTMLICM